MRSGLRIILVLAGMSAMAMAIAAPPDAVAKSNDDLAKKATYVGADTCKTCHPTKYEGVATTAHTKKTQEALKKNVVMPVNNKLTDIDGKVMFKLQYKKDTKRSMQAADQRLWLTLYDLDGTNATEYPVERVMGGAGVVGKQRLVILVDQHGDGVLNADGKVTRLISPVQYNEHDPRAANMSDNAFAAYNPQHWYNADGTLIGSSAARFSSKVAASQFANSWERRCIGCHATGAAVKFDVATGMFLNQSSEFNVWCEACHGPGSKHADTADPKYITNPVDWETKKPQQAMDVCARCHVRGSNVGNGNFSTGYPAKVKNNRVIFPPFGSLLADWYTNGEGLWGSDDAQWGKDATTLSFSKKHHQQGYDFVQSKHFNNPFNTVFCWDCHEPHSKGVEGPQLVASNDDNTLCLSCHADHGFGDEAAITAHTQHSYKPATLGTSRCSTCHMPKTAKSATWYNDHQGDIHSHTFEPVLPGLTKKMAKRGRGTDEDGTAIPNGCNSCHGASDYSAGLWKRWKKAGGGHVGS